MVTIKQAVFSVIWTTTYWSVLDGSVTGKLVTRAGYSAVFNARAPQLGLPWENVGNPAHWSSFWARYLGSPEAFRKLGSDAAWDHLIPLTLMESYAVTGPVGTDAHARVHIHPSAVTVIIDVVATGKWPVNRLAATLAALRADAHWSLQTARATSMNRTLDGIATALRDDAAKLLTGGPDALPSKQRVLTVAAPTSGVGNAAALELTDKSASSCLAGLAVLGPPGQLVDKHLIEQNSDPRLQGLFYALNDGHAVWHPDHVVGSPKPDSLECLLRNQAELVAHIAALAGVVSWAADQISANVQIPVATLGLVQRAVLRLNQLRVGDQNKTYRSGIAKVRIDPLADMLVQVAQATP